MSNIGKGDCKVIKFYLNVLPNRILYSTNIAKQIGYSKFTYKKNPAGYFRSGIVHISGVAVFSALSP